MPDTPLPPSRTRRSIPGRWLRIFGVLFLFFAAVQFPALLTFVTPLKWTRAPQVSTMGASAATIGWPASTPHERAWPEPSQASIETHFARSHQSASGNEVPDKQQTTHRMQHESYGWPLAALHRTQRWWPSSPTWAVEAAWDTGMRITWLGTILNPVIFAAGVSLIWLMPVAGRALILARRARRRGMCPHCGYPIGVSPVCTECGNPVKSDEPKDAAAV